MQDKRILEETLCLGTGVVESVRKEIDGTIVASCRPRKGQSNICPRCGVSVNIISAIFANVFPPIAPTRMRRIRQRGCAAFGV